MGEDRVSHKLHAEHGKRLLIHVGQEMIVEVDNHHGGHDVTVLMETPGGGGNDTKCGGYYTCSVADSAGKWKVGDQMYFTFAKNECPCHLTVTIPDGSSWKLNAGTCSSW